MTIAKGCTVNKYTQTQKEAISNGTWMDIIYHHQILFKFQSETAKQNKQHEMHTNAHRPK